MMRYDSLRADATRFEAKQTETLFPSQSTSRVVRTRIEAIQPEAMRRETMLGETKRDASNSIFDAIRHKSTRG